MRLKSVKLSGFKSFVDTTTIFFPSNLVAIVGPNGSGKSNIIDAIRWVLGEISPRYLRSETMSDVIFSGSSTRKPVGRAAVELLFDNSRGSFGGTYSQYEQIAIKRVVSLSHQSDYYLNNTRCRRRDIIDLFLGTGLGSCGYAMVMQDTVSRIVEAKPDELRGYLEEGAGISKYKERRRETEQRIRQTWENLSRLQDMRGEITKQLNHLAVQVQAATQYQQLREQERQAFAQIQTLQWQNLNLQSDFQQDKVSKTQSYLEQELVNLVKLDQFLEEQRGFYRNLTTKVTEQQSYYYEITTQVSQFEQEIKYQQSRYLEIKEQYQQVTLKIEQTQGTLKQKQIRQTNIAQQAQTLGLKLETANAHAEAFERILQHEDEKMHEWQSKWDNFNQQASLNQQKVHVFKAQISHLEQRTQEFKQRLLKLERERADLQFSQIEEAIEKLQNDIENCTEQCDVRQLTLQHLRQEMEDKSGLVQTFNQDLHQQRTRLQQLQGQFTSLTALQQAALGQEQRDLAHWLRQNELHQHHRLASLIEVEKGWERAVEMVLERYLQGVCLENLQDYLSRLSDLQEGQITLIDWQPHQVMEARVENQTTLAAKIQAASVIKNLLSSIYIAQTYEEAWLRVESLEFYESVITPEGVWFGQGWIYKHDQQDLKLGVIARHREINKIKIEIDELSKEIELIEKNLQQTRRQRQEKEQAFQEISTQLRNFSDQRGQLQAAYQLKIGELKHKKIRVDEVNQSIEECRIKIEACAEELIQIKAESEEYVQCTQADERQKKELQQQRDERRQSLDKLKRQMREAMEKASELKLQYRDLTTEQHSLPLIIISLEQEVLHLQNHQLDLTQKIQQTQGPSKETHNQLDVARKKPMV